MAEDLGDWLYEEQTETELLSDPIAELLMRYDGITVEDILAAKQGAQICLNPPSPKTDRAA